MSAAEKPAPSFSKPGCVSLWFFRGPARPEDAEVDLLRDWCGVDHYDLDQQEGYVPETPTAIPALLEPLSYPASFRAAAAAAAERAGIRSAYGVLVQFDFAYDPNAVTRPVASDLLYLGYFPWRDE